MPNQRLLACFAHPTMKLLVQAGTWQDTQPRDMQSHLVCATRGEAGEIADPESRPPYS